MNRLASYDFERERQLSRRIRRVSVPIARIFTDHHVPPLLIREDFESWQTSEIVDCGSGTGLVLPLKIVSSVARFFLSSFHVELDRWTGARFRPLEEIEKSERPHYEFYGRADLRFHRDQVLNRLITSKKPLPREYPVCGLLIASACASIPDDIQHGDVLEGLIWIYDQFDRPYSSEAICLRADRESWKLLKQRADGAPAKNTVTIGLGMGQPKEDREENDSRGYPFRWWKIPNPAGCNK